MRIAIFSDTHLGFEYGSERGEDSFLQAGEAIDKALSADLILLAGDLFDSRVPRQEVFAKALELFQKPLHVHGKRAKLIELRTEKPRELSPLIFQGIPIITVFGTHERRARELVNPVQALERAGFLLNLHCESALIEAAGEKIAIHGMGAVPEKFAKEVLSAWSPKPVPGCRNVLLMHQNIGEYIYSGDEPSLSLSDLPAGFDLIVLGHIHWSGSAKTKAGSNILLAGSTICTQMRKAELEPKKIFFYETKTEKIGSEGLETPRKLVYEAIEFKNAKPSEILEKLKAKVLQIGAAGKETRKPLVKIKLSGNLSGEYSPSDVDISQAYELSRGKMLLSVDKELTSERAEVKAELVRQLRERKMSVEEMGLHILRSNLKAKGFMGPDELFTLLSEGGEESKNKILEAVLK